MFSPGSPFLRYWWRRQLVGPSQLFISLRYLPSSSNATTKVLSWRWIWVSFIFGFASSWIALRSSFWPLFQLWPPPFFLHLGSNALSGRIPSELGQISRLQYINLGRSQCLHGINTYRNRALARTRVESPLQRPSASHTPLLSPRISHPYKKMSKRLLQWEQDKAGLGLFCH